jgi:glyoxylase-like metal-dependent hydrolase (beta-lactamase superfamily II)
MAGTVRIDHTVTSAPYEFDGIMVDLENNVWVLGDDDEAMVIDAPHHAQPIIDLVDGRRVVGVAITHAHRDHISVAAELGQWLSAPLWLHPADQPVWRLTHPDFDADGELSDGQVITVAGTDVQIVHTPGHTPGSVSLYVPSLDVVFTGDTLFPGGPGATGRPFSDFGTIITSVRDRLFTLPEDTGVLPGHGSETTIGTESPHLDEWIARGH